MGQERLTWFPFYPQDFLTSEKVHLMNYEEIGIYLVLLCYQWLHGSITADLETLIPSTLKLPYPPAPDNTDSLAAQRVVSQCFIEHPRYPNRLINARLESIRRQQSQLIQRRRNAGSRGGKAKALLQQTHSKRIAKGVAKSSYIEKELEKELEKKEEKKPPLVPLEGDHTQFDLFWKAYPRKEGKGACKKWWNTHTPSETLVRTMVEAITKAKATDKWHEEKGKFIPMPLTWLNQGRWEDELLDPIKPVWRTT